jgi:hypothetical protein
MTGRCPPPAAAVPREHAALVFDSAISVAAGARTTVLSERRRQLLWTSDRIDLALAMWTDDLARHAVMVDGQVLPIDVSSARCTVLLQIEGVPVARTQTDENGCFAFEGLDHGDYEFRIVTTDREIVAGPIAVSEIA